MSLFRDIQIMIDEIGNMMDQAGVPVKDPNGKDLTTSARISLVLQFNGNLQKALSDADAGMKLLGEVLEKHNLNREEELALLIEEKRKAAEAAE